MGLNCNGQLQLTCDTCGELHEIESGSLFFDEIDREEKENGYETLYQAEYDFVCEGCDKDIEITYEVWEYPDGTKENEKITITNGTVVKACEISLDA